MTNSLVSPIRAATVNWGVRKLTSVDGFFDHIREVVAAVVQQGATLLLLPELIEVEILTALGDGPEDSVGARLAPFAPRIESTFSELAQRYSVTIVGGSHLRSRADGTIFNCAPIALPDGQLRFQPKNCRTQWELSPWGLAVETGITKLPDPRLGVLICYDSEFPESARAQAEQGVQILCVPSYTESQHGYQRVHFSCRARAVENEIFVLQSCIVGPIECFGLGTGYGRSSILTPSKNPFPPSAVLAETALNEEGIAVADLDLAALATCRATGDVRPWNDRNLSAWQVRSK